MQTKSLIIEKKPNGHFEFEFSKKKSAGEQKRISKFNGFSKHFNRYSEYKRYLQLNNSKLNIYLLIH